MYPSEKPSHKKRWMNVLIEICPSFFLPDGEKSFMPSPRGRTGWGKKTNIIVLLSYHTRGIPLSGEL